MENIKNILQDMGYQLTSDGSYWRTTSIYRGGNNNTSLRIHKNTGRWSDFGNAASGSFEKLIALSKKITIEEAKDILGNAIFEFDFTYCNNLMSEKVFSESLIKHLIKKDKSFFWKKRGIEEATLFNYEGGYVPYNTNTELDKISGRYTFILRNEIGQIVGFCARDIENNKQKKWKIIGEKFKSIFPNISEFNNEEIYIVESIGDFLSFKKEFPQKGCVVIFGLTIPQKIISLLSSSQSKIVICFNNDKKQNGSKAAVKNYQELKKLCSNVSIKLPLLQDLGEMNKKDYKVWESKKSLGVVGSRSFNNYSYLSLILNKNKKNIGQIVSGGANGVDSLAARWAIENNIPLVEFLPDWNKHGKSAGFIRIKDIVLNSDSVVTFHKNKSRGTQHSIDLAKKFNKNLKIIEV